ncbi:MAG TPA: NUDIX hydrolase [Chthoniobacteraceae bacterium]|nr:NUDIX hydrolase [Chthoniobacteraceae bacterium]
MGKFHDLIPEEGGWKTLRRENLYDGPHIQVEAIVRQTPSRPEGVPWTVIHRRAACVIAPLTAEGGLILIRQERVPVCRELWEFPAGQVDRWDGPDTLRETALRELTEETGYRLAEGGELRAMGHFFPSSGVMDECSFLFLASPVVPAPHGATPEESEAITACRTFTPAQLRTMIAEGEIVDANTLAAYARLAALGWLPPPGENS